MSREKLSGVDIRQLVKEGYAVEDVMFLDTDPKVIKANSPEAIKAFAQELRELDAYDRKTKTK